MEVRLPTQAREKARHYEHKEIGYNYRMSNIVAGIGRGQLKVIDERIAQKRHIFAYYQEHLGDLENVLGTDSDIYRLLVLSGFGDEAEKYMYVMASRVLSVVVTYLTVKLLLKTLIFSLEFVSRVPGISFLNRIAGAAFGLLQQMLVLWLLMLVVAVFSMTPWGSQIYEFVHGSMVLNLIYENNPILLIGIVLVLHP